MKNEGSIENVIRYLTKDMSAFKIWRIDKYTDLKVWWAIRVIKFKNFFHIK